MNSVGYAMSAEETTSYQEAVKSTKKQKKVGWLKRKFAEWSREAWENSTPPNQIALAERESRAIKLAIGNQHASIDQPERAIHFTVYTANGGRIVETRRIDRKTDRSTNGLYIITNDQEFGREIDKIITMEALK